MKRSRTTLDIAFRVACMLLVMLTMPFAILAMVGFTIADYAARIPLRRSKPRG